MQQAYFIFKQVIREKMSTYNIFYTCLSFQEHSNNRFGGNPLRKALVILKIRNKRDKKLVKMSP